MGDVDLFACADFWRDLKELRKHIKKSFVDCPFSEEDFEKLSCMEKISCIPILYSISTAIKNKLDKLHEIRNNERNGQQPFLEKEFVLWKLRWAVDRNGARYGLRITYLIRGNKVVFAAIKRKKDIADDERDFQTLTKERLKVFLTVNFNE